MTTKKQKLREVEAKLDKKDLLGYSTTPSGNVVLKMTPYDYNMILVALGVATGHASHSLFFRNTNFDSWVELVDRINEGNPNYLRYTKGKNAKAKTR
jgi:hypothetical protein